MSCEAGNGIQRRQGRGSQSHGARPGIVVCDDDEDYTDALQLHLGDEFDIFSAANAAALTRVVASQPVSLVLLDLRLPDEGEGFRLLGLLKAHNRRTAVIVHSALDDCESVVRAMHLAADDYAPKGRGIEALRSALRRWTHPSRRACADRPSSGSFIANSSAARDCLAQARRFVAARGHVMLLGESGSGKSLLSGMFAPRRGPAVAVDAASWSSEGLAEIDLLDSSAPAEILERARGWVLILEGIGNLAHVRQTHLLRVLDQSDAASTYASRYSPPQLRVVCTAQQDQDGQANLSQVRRDLLMRVAVLVLQVPPLRGRVEDIGPLAQAFVDRFRPQARVRLEKTLLEALEAYHWPGNVRQLANAMHFVLAAAGEKDPSRDHFAAFVRASSLISFTDPSASSTTSRSLSGSSPEGDEKSFRRRRAEQESQLLADEYRKCGRSVTRLSEQVGMSRTYLYAKLRRAGIIGKNSGLSEPEPGRG